MATRTTQGSQNRTGYSPGGGARVSDVAVGTDVVARMAREDARWFAVAVVILSLVLLLALPLSVLVVVDHLKLKSQVQAEVKKVRELRRQLEEEVKKEK